MSFMSRMSNIFQAKLNRLAENLEDPAADLDLSYERQQQLLQQIKRSIVEVTTSRKSLEAQLDRARQDMSSLEDQARQALAAGREDLAREALQRRQTAATQIDTLEQQAVELEEQQRKLEESQQRLTAKLEAFRTQKEVIKAQYKSAEVEARINESFAGVSEELTDVGMAVERVQDKTKVMQARARAVDELVESGQLEEIGGREDQVTRELKEISLKQNVDADLARLKAELSPPPPSLPKPGEGA